MVDQSNSQQDVIVQEAESASEQPDSLKSLQLDGNQGAQADTSQQASQQAASLSGSLRPKAAATSTVKKFGKKYRKSLSLVDRKKLYPIDEALKIVKETSYTSFDSTVELAVNLGVDPRHVDQNVRGVAALPRGRGKEVRIIVFAKGEKAMEAAKKDVVAVGGADLVEKIQGGWLEFDQVIASPDMMGLVGKLGRVLGPRGLMPNPKLGTVTSQVVQAIDEFKAGRAEFRVEKAGIIHVAVGKVSMEVDALVENTVSVMEALMRAKPATAKGTYVKRVTVSATMSPGVKVDTDSVIK